MWELSEVAAKQFLADRLLARRAEGLQDDPLADAHRVEKVAAAETERSLVGAVGAHFFQAKDTGQVLDALSAFDREGGVKVGHFEVKEAGRGEDGGFEGTGVVHFLEVALGVGLLESALDEAEGVLGLEEAVDVEEGKGRPADEEEHHQEAVDPHLHVQTPVSLVEDLPAEVAGQDGGHEGLKDAHRVVGEEGQTPGFMGRVAERNGQDPAERTRRGRGRRR